MNMHASLANHGRFRSSRLPILTVLIILFAKSGASSRFPAPFNDREVSIQRGLAFSKSATGLARRKNCREIIINFIVIQYPINREIKGA